MFGASHKNSALPFFKKNKTRNTKLYWVHFFYLGANKKQPQRSPRILRSLNLFGLIEIQTNVNS